MFQTKAVEKIEIAHFIFTTFFPEIRAVFEIMWENKVVPDWPQMTVRRMRIVCFIIKATDTHNECVIRIGFFTATVVAQTRHNLAFICTLPVLFVLLTVPPVMPR